MRIRRLASPDLCRIFRGETISGLSEWQLLERYLERRDELAFEAIVSRHGPMVMGVCRRILGASADVEDAFQATFLVLVRRARQLGPRDAIGPWLHGVAARVAARARSQAARRRHFEPIGREHAAVAPVEERNEPDLGEVLDQELSRLPSKYRSPLVLCYLEGRTHEEAARALQWPVGTVKGRLARGRDLLRSRLTRRGIAPAAAVLTSMLASQAKAALERPLLARTVGASLKVAMGQSLSQVVSVSITSLTEGALTAMLINQFKWVGLAALATGLTVTTAGALARQGITARSEAANDTAKATAGKAAMKKPARMPPQENAQEGVPADPRQQLVHAARSAYQATWEAFRDGNASADQLYDASRQWMEAQVEGPDAPSAKAAAATAHLERMRDLLRTESDRPRSPSKAAEVARVKAYVSQARFWLAQAGEPSSEKGAGNGDGAGPGQDPRSLQIIAKLEEPISMSFANETPLDDLLKYIQQATTSPTVAGVPIYVDPIGLQEAERSLNSTITIDLEGVPLRRTLQLLLAQLGLIYHVEDGMIYITSAGSENVPLPPALRRPNPLLRKVAKAEDGELTRAEMEDLIADLKTRQTVMKLASVQAEATKEEGSKSEGEAKRDRERMDLLLKEMQELIGLLKAERQGKPAAGAK
jgi:RNA polymerase sigma factor (sigma-70 family)